MTPALQAVLASVLSSLLGLAGGFLLLANYAGVKRVAHYFVSFAAGALLGAAFFDILTDAISGHPDQLTPVFVWVMVGFLLFFIIEKFMIGHHHSHGDEMHQNHRSLIPMVIVGDTVHNFIDGTIIAAAFLVNPALGMTTAVAVFFHEIPQEIGDFSILIHGGMRRAAVAWWNIWGALVSPIGALVTIWAAGRIDGLTLPLLGIAAGNFIYIAAADLVPEIHRERGTGKILAQLALLILGIVTIVAVGNIVPE